MKQLFRTGLAVLGMTGLALAAASDNSVRVDYLTRQRLRLYRQTVLAGEQKSDSPRPYQRTLGNQGLPEFDVLLKALGDEDVDVRYGAVDALVDMGEPVVPRLVEALTQEKHRDASNLIALSLGRIGLPAVPALVSALKDSSDLSRDRLACALGRMGNPAIPPLLEALSSESWTVRSGALRALGNMGVVGHPAVTRVIGALREEGESAVRAEAASCLGHIAGDDEAALHAVIDVFRNDPESTVREAAVAALGQFLSGKDLVPPLLDALKDPSGSVRSRALLTLGDSIGDTSTAVPALIAALRNDSDADVRRYAAWVLGSVCRTEDKEVTATLNDAIQSDCCTRVRAAAGVALARTTSDTAVSVTALVTALRNDPSSPAIELLGAIDRPEVSAAVPDLLKALRNGDPFVRQSAAIALGEIGSVAAVPREALLEALTNDKDTMVRGLAAIAIAKIGPMSEQTTATFGEILKLDSDVRVRRAVAYALGRGGVPAKSVVPLLVHVWERDPDVRKALADALGRFGSEAAPAMSFLLEALTSAESFTLRSAAAEAIGRIGPVTDEVVPTLVSSLRDRSNDVRRSATLALASIGPVQECVIPELIETLKDGDDSVVFAACFALGKFGSAARDAVPDLIALLERRNRDYGILLATVESLGGIGPPAIPALLEASGNPDGIVRYYVLLALAKIDVAYEVVGFVWVQKLNDEDGGVRLLAAECLGQAKKASDRAIPVLVSLMEDERSDFRGRAADALGDFGKSADVAVLALQRALNDRDADVRNRVSRALRRIKGADPGTCP